MFWKIRTRESRSRDSELTAIRNIEKCGAGHMDARAVGWRLQGGSKLQDTECGDGAFLQGTACRDASTERTRGGLEERVTVSNQTLKAALAQYTQARAAVQQYRSYYFPTVSLTPGYSRTRVS